MSLLNSHIVYVVFIFNAYFNALDWEKMSLHSCRGPIKAPLTLQPLAKYKT